MERNGEVRELEPLAHRVGEHLFNQVESGHPLLTEPGDRFTAAAIVAEFTGKSEAFAFALNELRQHPQNIPASYAEDLADAILQQQGPAGAVTAREIANLLPPLDQEMESSFHELVKPTILTKVAEATDDPELRTAVTDEAVALLEEKLAENPAGHSIGDYPSDLLVRLGTASQRVDLIYRAAEALPPHAFKFGFLEAVADALKKDDLPSELHTALSWAATHVQDKGISYPAPIVRYGYSELLDEARMKMLLTATHRREKVPFVEGADAILFPSGREAISATNGTEMAAFNKLASRYDSWTSNRQHARFAYQALKARISEKVHGEGRTRSGSFFMAASSARSLTKKIKTTPALQNPDVLDSTLTQGYRMIGTDANPSERQAYASWAYGLMPALHGSSIARATKAEYESIHKLRDMLPLLSAARIALNAALFEAGEREALADSAHALTSEPHALITRVINNEESGETFRRPNLYPYRWDFFMHIKDASETGRS